MASSTSNDKSDWYLQSSRAKPLVPRPDGFYLEFIYNTLHNHLYHMDADCILVNMQTLEPVAIMEQITGLEKKITGFKMTVYSKIARMLHIPFYIINWDQLEGVHVIDVFRDTTKFQTWQEHAKWLRDFKYSTHPHATPHSECCDCNQCIPDLKT